MPAPSRHSLACDIHAPVAGMSQRMEIAIIHERFQFHFEGTASISLFSSTLFFASTINLLFQFHSITTISLGERPRCRSFCPPPSLALPPLCCERMNRALEMETEKRS